MLELSKVEVRREALPSLLVCWSQFSNSLRKRNGNAYSQTLRMLRQVILLPAEGSCRKELGWRGPVCLIPLSPEGEVKEYLSLGTSDGCSSVMAHSN